MKASELRIGNYVIENGLVVLVTSVLPSDINCEFYETETEDRGEFTEVSEGLPIDSISPIELDAEWLLKLGFKFSKKTETYYFKYSMGYDRYFEVWDNVHDWGVSICKEKQARANPDNFLNIGRIKHVHTLQNLYNSLTGNELRLN